MKKQQPPRSFLQQDCSENSQTCNRAQKKEAATLLGWGCSEKNHAMSPFLIRKFQVIACNCTKKVLHHHCFPNNFVKLCSSIDTIKNDYMADGTTPGKQKDDAPINYLVILTLLLLVLNITLLAGFSPLNPWLTIIRFLFFSTTDKFCCIVFKNNYCCHWKD